MPYNPNRDSNKKPRDNQAKLEKKNLEEQASRQKTDKHSYSKKTDHL
ncbi:MULTISPECIES: hypothetical protein [Alteribacter]|nr:MULTISPECIES: hypothetical protein [Alteribacter]MBM7097853.1 hypothetical protein [Alteribacter salitolerans]